MSPGLRNALRWLHIALGAVILGTFLYSPGARRLPFAPWSSGAPFRPSG